MARIPKKIIFSALVATSVLFLAAYSSSASAAPADVAIKGSARLRYEDTQNYGTSTNPLAFERAAVWSVRIRPNLTLKMDDSFSIVMEPQFAKYLGRDYAYGLTDSSGTSAYNEHFHMHQAYLKWKVSDYASVRAGRMSIKYGDDAVISQGNWSLTGRAFDGAIFNYTDDLVYVDLLGLKLESTAARTGSDRELSGIYTSWELTPALKDLDLYYLYETNQMAGANEARSLFGGRVALVHDSGFDFGAEVASASGTSGFIASDKTPLMTVASFGYKFEEASKLRIGVEYDSADQYWREWYPTTKSALGRNDVVGRRNLTAIAGRISFDPIENVNVKLDYWMYSRTDDAAPAYRTTDSTAIGAAAGSTSKDIGSSAEILITQKATENIEYGVSFAYFTPGAYLKEQFDDRALTDFYALTNITF